MAWHRDSLGALAERLVFSVIAFTTLVMLGRHTEELNKPKKALPQESSFSKDPGLYPVFIPFLLIDIFLVLKVSLTDFQIVLFKQRNVLFWGAFTALSFVQFVLSVLNASSAYPRCATFLPFQIILIFFDVIVIINLRNSKFVKKLDKKF